MPTGKDERFGLRETPSPEHMLVGDVFLAMADADGLFYADTTRDLSTKYTINFDLNDTPVQAALRFQEYPRPEWFSAHPYTGPGIPSPPPGCIWTITQIVRPRHLIVFPSRCARGLRQRPRTVIVACGDGNFQLKRMRWRRWGGAAALGRGASILNDCVPSCAAGHFHRGAVRARLYRRRRCANVQRFVYTRLKYRLLSRLPGGGPRTGTVPYNCSLYHT